MRIKILRFFGLYIPETVRDHVNIIQAQQLKRNSMILYFLVFSISVAVTISNPDVSIINPFVMPGLFFIIFAFRFIDWHFRVPQNLKGDAARSALRRVFFVGVFVALGSSIWAVSAYLSVKDHLHGSIPLFVVLSTYATATCLSVYPQLALAVLGICLAPMSLAMLFSNNLQSRAMAASIIMVTVLQGWIIARKFGNLVQSSLLQHSMRLLAETDALTGLANRRGFRAMLETATLQKRASFSVLMLDLDKFKPVNDTHGHAAGDLLLVEVALRLKKVLPDAELVARLGGDEFAVLFNSRLDQPELQVLRNAMAEPYLIEGISLNVGASIGCAIYPLHGTTAKHLLSRADAGLYACKKGINLTLVA